jgi:hypothetical protein
MADPWPWLEQFDRKDQSSYIATIGASSSTRGSYRQLEGGDLLKEFGPRSLTVKNSLEKASITVIEEYEPWGYPGGTRLRAIKYLLPMRDDYEWIMDTSDYRDLYYGGFSGDASAEGTITLGALGAAINDNLYYMYLKRAAIVPVGLPRTTFASDWDAEGSKKAGFLDTNDYFRYTSSFQYYGEIGGIDNKSGKQIRRIESNRINWEYIGTINQMPSASPAGGSWNTLIEEYYIDAPNLDYLGARNGAMGMHSMGDSASAAATIESNYYEESLTYTQGYSKNLIKVQSTSVTKSDFEGFEEPLPGSPGTEGAADDPAYQHYNSNSQGGEYTTQDTTSTMKSTNSEGFTNPDGSSCSSPIGAFLYEYCGPLYPHGLLLLPGGTPSPFGDALGDFGEFINMGIDTGLTRHPYFTQQCPVLNSDGWVGDEGGSQFTTDAVFSMGGNTAESALRIRFGSDSRSLGRAHAYLDYYTGYLYEKVEQDPIPREYKTKMQATPKLDPKLMSAVTGKRNPNYSNPSTSEVSTATTTSDMGSSY